MKCKKNINLKKKMDEKKVYELFRLAINENTVKRRAHCN